MPYLLDANIFIQASQLYYSFDICPGFWSWVVELNAKERVFSIDKVRDEIAQGNDQLVNWARHLGGKLFKTADAEVMKGLGTVSTWVMDQPYEQAAKNTFMQVADYWLVGHALAKGYTLVTMEIAGGGAKRVKIPDVCVGLRVECITPFTMLRRERARFVLD